MLGSLAAPSTHGDWKGSPHCIRLPPPLVPRRPQDSAHYWPRQSIVSLRAANDASLSAPFSALVILWGRELKKKPQR